MAGPGNILIRIGADAGDAIRGLKSVHGPLSDVQTRGEKMSAGIRKAAVPAAATLVALGAAGLSAAKAAAEDQAAQAKLAGALERTAGATKAQISQAEDWISKTSLQVGVADDELRPALARLASATGDVGTAQSRLKLALDISAQSGKSLDVVTKALAAAEDGRTTSLAKLVPGLDQATLKSKDMTAITAELAEKTGGAAVEAANTATGRYKIMQIQLGELQEEIGAALIPVIGAMVAIVSKATAFAAEHTTAVKLVIAAVAGLSAAVLLVNIGLKLYTTATTIAKVATATWTAIQWLLNAALTANPIGIVVVAIAALTAGVILAYKKSETFRDAVGLLWDILRNSPLGQLITHFGDLINMVERLIGWLGRIHWPSPPGWLSKVGGWLGGALSVPAPVGAARAVAAAPAGSSRSLGPLSAGSSSSSGGGIVINIFGATDPEGTARAIRRTLRGFERRQGGFAAVTVEAAGG